MGFSDTQVRHEYADSLAYQLIHLQRVADLAGEFDLIHYHVDYLHYPVSRLLGKTAAELLGRSASSILPPELALVWTGRVAKIFSGKSVQLRERCGENTWDISVFPIRLEGVVRGAGGRTGERVRARRHGQGPCE